MDLINTRNKQKMQNHIKYYKQGTNIRIIQEGMHRKNT